MRQNAPPAGYAIRRGVRPRCAVHRRPAVVFNAAAEDVMRTSRLLGSLQLVGVAIVMAGAARGGTQTYVALAGRDDSLPKLGRPGILLRVDASSVSDADVVKVELARELAQQVHTRRLAQDEAAPRSGVAEYRSPIAATNTLLSFFGSIATRPM